MKRKFCHYLLPIAAVCAISNSAYAQEEAKENNQALDRLIGGVALDYSQNAYDHNSYNANRSTGITARIGYKGDYNQRIMLSGGTSYHHDGEEGWYANDLWVSFAKPDIFQPTDWLTIGGDARFAIPISDFSQKTDLRTALRGSVNFNFDLTSWLEGLSFTFQPRFKVNFHEYKTAGSVNLVEYSAGSLYALNYGYEKWSLSVQAINPHSWTYNGTYTSPSLTHIEHLGYQITDNWSLGLGHTNSTSFFDPDQGPSPAEQFFDIKSSTFYGTVIYSF